MDNLTHGLVGAAIARAGADRATPLAMTTLVVAANAPDVDMLAFLGGPYFALAHRRGLTHGWPAMIVLPFVVTAFVLAWDRWIRRARKPGSEPARAGPVLGLAVVGVASHPLLDWMNTYGMRWGLPFDGDWSYGDALFIIDPWLWLTLGGACALAVRPSLRSGVGWVLVATATTVLVTFAPVSWGVRLTWWVGVGLIAALSLSVRRPVSRAAVGIVLAVSATYVGAQIAANRIARARVAEAAATADIEALDVMVAPLPGDPFRSEVEVVTPAGYVPGTYRWTGTPRVELRPEAIVPALAAPGVPRSEVPHVLEAAQSVPDVRYYLVWARYPWTRIDAVAEGWRVRIGDARYDQHRTAGSLGGLQVVVPRRRATDGSPRDADASDRTRPGWPGP